VRSVFSQREYHRSILRSLWDLLLERVWRFFAELFSAVGSSTAARTVSIAVVVVILLFIAARIVLSFAGSGLGLTRIGSSRGAFGSSGDAWAEAQRLAAAGDFTSAAHALYAGLLRGLAARDQVRVHPSKTVGDYARELRRRSSTVLAPFRDFARNYEVVVYGLGYCDRDRYERLHALASSIVAPKTAVRGGG
jgi:hypothetical protein